MGSVFCNCKMSNTVYRYVTHAQKVCSLYKRALRETESWINDKAVFRYEATLLRARFEKNKHIQDMRESTALLNDGEEELFQYAHYQPKKFPYSPGGVAYERVFNPADWVIDYWHPKEKEVYPEYFARREERKKEFIKFWQDNYANAPNIDEYLKNNKGKVS